MFFNAKLRLTELECKRPQETNDEPYLWTLFFSINGENIRQHPTDPTKLIGNVQVVRGVGSQGNLGTGPVRGSTKIQVPSIVGLNETNFQPIPFKIHGRRLWLPSFIGLFFVLIEEDASIPSAMEAACDEARLLVQNTIQDLTLSLNLSGFAGFVLPERSDGATGATLDLHDSLLFRLVTLSQTIMDLADARAGVAATSKASPWEIVKAFFDRDEVLGARVMMLGGKQAFDLSLMVGHPVTFESFFGSSSLDPAYVVRGDILLSANFSDEDIQPKLIEESIVEVQNGQYVYPEDKICIPQGTLVDWGLEHRSQIHEIVLEYPYGWRGWAIDGQELIRPPSTPAGKGYKDTLTLQKQVKIPKFDPQSLVMSKSEMQSVTINWQVVLLDNDPQIERLRISNNPADGNFSCKIDLVIGGFDGSVGPILTPPGQKPEEFATIKLSASVVFNGQNVRIEHGFLTTYRQCIEKLFSHVSTAYAKSRLFAARDIWGPYGLHYWAREINETAGKLAAAGVLEPREAEILNWIARRRLSVIAGVASPIDSANELGTSRLTTSPESPPTREID